MQLALILGSYIRQLRCWFAHKQFELIDQGTIPPATLYFLPHDGKGLFRGKRLAVGPVRSKRVINVRDLKDARGERNLCALQPVRVPGAVLLLMVVTNDRQHITEGSEWGANFLANHGVTLHDLSFFRSQWSGFEQYVLRHGQLADIVYQAASAQSDAQVLGQTQLFPQRNRILRKAIAVPFGIGILRLDSQRKAKQDRLGVIQLIGEFLQAQQGMHASQQLVLVDGLVEEIISAAHDPVDAVGVTVQTS